MYVGMRGGGSGSPDTALLTGQMPTINSDIQQQLVEQAKRQDAQMQAQQNALKYGALVMATAAQSNNPQLMQTARAHLTSMGINPDIYSQNPKTVLQQAPTAIMGGAAPGALLDYQAKNNEINQRYYQNASTPDNAPQLGGIFSGSQPTGAQPSPQGGQQTQPSAQNPPALPAQQNNSQTNNGMTVPQVLQSAQTQQHEQPQQSSGEASPPPQPNQFNTGAQYQRALELWKEQNAVNPQLQSTLANQKEAGAQTPIQVKALNAAVIGSSNMINSLSIIQQAANQAKVGAFGPAQASLYKLADIFGLPHKMVPAVTGYGDIAKITNVLIGAAAKETGGASRLQSDFKAIQAAVPGLSTDPNAMNSLLPILTRNHYQLMREQAAWNSYVKGKPNATFNSFETPWLAQEVKNQQQQGGNLPSYPLPTNLPAKGSEAYDQQQQAQPQQVFKITPQGMMQAQKYFTPAQIAEYKKLRGIK